MILEEGEVEGDLVAEEAPSSILNLPVVASEGGNKDLTDHVGFSSMATMSLLSSSLLLVVVLGLE